MTITVLGNPSTKARVSYGSCYGFSEFTSFSIASPPRALLIHDLLYVPCGL